MYYQRRRPGGGYKKCISTATTRRDRTTDDRDPLGTPSPPSADRITICQTLAGPRFVEYMKPATTRVRALDGNTSVYVRTPRAYISSDALRAGVCIRAAPLIRGRRCSNKCVDRHGYFFNRVTNHRASPSPRRDQCETMTVG